MSDLDRSSSWALLTLNEIGTLQRGRSRHRPRYAFHLYGGNYPFIQTGEIREARKYVRKFEQTYSDAGLQQSKLWPKGTLCITIAANIAELAILGFDACFPDSVLGFLPDQTKANLDFVYYTLVHFQSELKHAGEGSVQDNINLGTFENRRFPVPELPEQEGIAAILSDIDEKIDLLGRQNQTLEAMAETLFRQWFLEAGEDHWTEYSVSDFADHVKQGAQPGDQPWMEYLHYSLPAFDAGQRPVVELGSQILSNKFKVSEGVLLVSKLNPRVPRIWPVDKLPTGANAICSTEFQVLRPKKPAWFGYLYGLLTSVEARDSLTMAASGTSGSHQRVRPEDILALKTSLPSMELAEQFSSWIEPVLSKRQRNIEQMTALERLRDTLLPKLMSGEVRVAF